MLRFLTFILILFVTSASATEVITWKKEPIRITLTKGKERLLKFPDHVFYQKPLAVSDKVDISSAQGTVYITAKEEFDTTRFRFRLNDSQKIILVDIQSVDASNITNENVIIKLPQKQKVSSEYVQENATSNTTSGRVTPIQLTRYASRALYGPERLALSDSRIATLAAPDIDLSNLFTGTSFNTFKLSTIAVFKTDEFVLTAIKIVNKSMLEQPIEFKDINADFSYATPQHLFVRQKNAPGDTTVLYLVTDKPLANAIYVF
ncbi:TIGR03749 family integrating conjugative element protein [Moritella sp. F3]|uniref:TIGR03749 family integrating conjugative element protein n=1 Tax=Moritella sp. F3 TaxID=2718882 RepID=UPI0018E1B026|nr:TIGR03749 family integrating conjugative element protein [Moritella sp. F3]GIC77589.1 integrating conjugative element protein [Moritella sp. F1]GIC82002.1 integrating conjugative element protein [Moritella sp. F3]